MLRSRDLYSEIEIFRGKLSEIEISRDVFGRFMYHITVAHIYYITSQSHISQTPRELLLVLLHVSVAFFLTNCCDSWPLRARRRKCRVGAVQASGSYVSRLVTYCPSCVTLLLSDICVFVRFGEIWTSS